ncbi:hypothetical protein NSK_004843 [Nannochloropsis salina CCMP1776]|uniref:Nascent polypeptide-associated complex subunit beta n=2 Tax=Monodopsidaceae TaxID=425072 RepID=W7UA11_9STRA|nr:Nascent polypeptide-associated complex NAC [Nannochloropsis gaditana]TFJ83739.1 hypothetical protein NSK_004843 [Nannochloropsis salina CCMP1776]|eukprot:TFJ83739.1 hypothetical protein NSK_004843 [Nannochloropsis salina CCMP1776]
MADGIDAARARMIAKRFGGAENVRTGGKGTVRRKRKAQHKTSSTADDKKLGATLKKLGVTNIPGIEEANMFKNTGEVIHFRNPKVQASIQAKTYVISGAAETKSIQDLLPGIIQQLGGENIQALSKQLGELAKGGGLDPALAGMEEGENEEDDDDAVPDLVENFEAVST